MVSAVHAVDSDLYSSAQKKAWCRAVDARNHAEWGAHFYRNTTFLLLHNHVPAAFISFTADGYIDLLYSTPAWQGLGYASRLLQEAVYCLPDKTPLRVCASLAALPFFLNRRFHDSGLQYQYRFGIALPCHYLYRIS